MRIFVIECPNPIDLLEDRAEHQCIEKIGKLMGHQVVSILVKSKEELKITIEYISTLNDTRDDKIKTPLCIHISAHGDSDGLQFGSDELSWADLVKVLSPILEISFDYNGKKILVLSACGANQQKITKEIKKQYESNNISPLDYVFAINQDEVKWNDAVLAWTILYHHLAENDLSPLKMMNILKRVSEANLPAIRYNRWSNVDKKYKRFQNNI